MTVTTLKVAFEPLVSTCTFCTHLIRETSPGVFAHIDDQCRECFGTGQPCPYPEDHGVHEYFSRENKARVTCVWPEAHQCRWCHRVLDAAELPCPDHIGCCGGCCQLR